jgi:hypothetical protein
VCASCADTGSQIAKARTKATPVADGMKPFLCPTNQPTGASFPGARWVQIVECCRRAIRSYRIRWIDQSTTDGLTGSAQPLWLTLPGDPGAWGKTHRGLSQNDMIPTCGGLSRSLDRFLAKQIVPASEPFGQARPGLRSRPKATKTIETQRPMPHKIASIFSTSISGFELAEIRESA